MLNKFCTVAKYHQDGNYIVAELFPERYRNSRSARIKRTIRIVDLSVTIAAKAGDSP